MFNQIAINSNTYSGFSLEEAVQGASKAGFSKIELAAVEHTPHVLNGMSEKELRDIKTLLESYRMTCIGIGAHSNLMTDEGIDNLLKAVDLAVYFDCSYIITSTGEAHGDGDVIEDETILVRNLTPVLDKCESKNITLAVETHGNNNATGSALGKLSEKLNHRIKINYDTANVIFYGDVMPYDDLEVSMEHVGFIHLKDKLGHNQEWNFPAIGEGHLDFRRIFHILEENNFIGPISVEIEFTPDGPKNLAEVDKAVKSSFDYLKKLLGQES